MKLGMKTVIVKVVDMDEKEHKFEIHSDCNLTELVNDIKAFLKACVK